MRFALRTGSALAVAAALLLSACAASRIDASRRLARDSVPFSVAPPQATARLLIVGDSTGVGTGASRPGRSLAGQLARALPSLAIDNAAADGARFADVLAQLDAPLARKERYDAVLVMAGGNDVIRFTGRTRMREDVDGVVSRARELAPLVIVMPAGNVGNAPFFLPPLSWVMSARAKSMHEIVREAAGRHGAAYVNLYKPRAEDPFALDPDRLNAADGLHPSDEGYRVWLDQLLAQSPLAATAVNVPRPQAAALVPS